MSIFTYEYDEIHDNRQEAFERIERMVESRDENCEASIQILYNYVGNFLKIFKVEDDNMIYLHESLSEDLVRIQNRV